MLEYDFAESVGYWVMMTAHVYERSLNEELAPLGITFRQLQVLGSLALFGPLSQRELAERMRIEPPTLVGILDRMERDGWLRRRVCPRDRRKKLIYAARNARPVWSKMVACAKRVRSRAISGISRREFETIKNLLQRVQRNLDVAQAVKKAV